jgi:CRP/FNR family cyclic AMP-dependent transcriptional regulator
MMMTTSATSARGETGLVAAAKLQSEEVRCPQGFAALTGLPQVERTFWRGTTIYSLDDPATHIYLVRSGRVKIVRASVSGQNKIISIRYRGDVFGELALAGGAVEARRSDEAVALETTRVAVVRAEDFWQATRHDPAAMQNVLRCLTARLAEAHRQIESLVFDNNHRRLARALLDLSIDASRVGEASIRLTHEELAELIGSTREVVTSMMIELRQRGLIEYKRGEVRPDLPKLVELLAEEDAFPGN